ncbi:ATP-grasp domain-containing protein [Pseudomonas sp. NY11955]|uniref:ATP-grasp domain-containing protein n=1 Tax=Pseudomonas sp. NY11955 TaxID=3400363 RepID=UPI003A87547D
MNKHRAILVVDPVSSSCHFGHAIQSKGYLAVALVSVKKLSPGLRRLQKLGEFDHIVYAGNLSSALNILSKFDIYAVVPGSDFGLALADSLSDHYGLVGNSTATSLARVDKWVQKMDLKKNGVDVALGVEGGFALADKENLACLEYPVVVKPSRGTGSRDVKLCRNYDEVVTSISGVGISEGDVGGGERRALVEEYLDGDEFLWLPLILVGEKLNNIYALQAMKN